MPITEEGDTGEGDTEAAFMAEGSMEVAFTVGFMADTSMRAAFTAEAFTAPAVRFTRVAFMAEPFTADISMAVATA
jgi:hypothetical protein